MGEDFLLANQELLEAAKARAKNSGYDVDKVRESALGYIKAAKELKMNTNEFYASLVKARELVNQSLSARALPDITDDDAKV